MTDGPVLLGTGAREYADTRTLDRRMDALLDAWGPMLVIDGRADGFDRALNAWAVRHRHDGVTWRRYRADWSGPAGLGAGSERNQLMVDQLAGVEQRLALIGLHPGALNIGTLDCAARILTAHIQWEAWWGATGLTPSRPVGRAELERLIEEAKRAKAARQAAKRREARDGWMEPLDVG